MRQTKCLKNHSNSIFSGCQVSASGYFPVSTLPRRNNYLFFGSGPNWAHFGGFGGSNSSKQRQIKLEF